MNILIVGVGSGSWEMRGVQLGAALGARVTLTPSAQDVAWADRLVLVKRAILQWGPQLSGEKPIIWDALDFWSQPAQNGFDEAAALQQVRATTSRVKPALIIGATQAMATSIASLGFETAYLPHHSWSGLQPTPAREQVRTVAYEGNPVYLGRWARWLEEACRARRWSFVINPPDLSQADILVAFRDGMWDGWICREWKSGVKLVNAMAAGRPIITQLSAAFRELNPAGAAIGNRPALEAAFDKYTPQSVRASVVEQARVFSVQDAAARYRLLLERVACPA